MKMKYVNACTERVFGYSAEELLGKNVKILMDSETGKRHQSDIDR
jgi:PAS domain S-box-containing protein